jgi:hypothetical protein
MMETMQSEESHKLLAEQVIEKPMLDHDIKLVHMLDRETNAISY